MCMSFKMGPITITAIAGGCLAISVATYYVTKVCRGMFDACAPQNTPEASVRSTNDEESDDRGSLIVITQESYAGTSDEYEHVTWRRRSTNAEISPAPSGESLQFHLSLDSDDDIRTAEAEAETAAVAEEAEAELPDIPQSVERYATDEETLEYEQYIQYPRFIVETVTDEPFVQYTARTPHLIAFFRYLNLWEEEPFAQRRSRAKELGIDFFDFMVSECYFPQFPFTLKPFDVEQIKLEIKREEPQDPFKELDDVLDFLEDVGFKYISKIDYMRDYRLCCYAYVYTLESVQIRRRDIIAKLLGIHIKRPRFIRHIPHLPSLYGSRKLKYSGRQLLVEPRLLGPSKNS